ncbi:hypothetical protein B0I35DRAFT_49687 [Stachybotrys elegans]|uniref:Protein Zds1 C-terminal domain-containing protein n=1 Tax=Stachybotrys elegans TaxID=80388 RepID=A0A8K0WPG6_9HYPO|nr:hypothetical protein B0I35DRAFT_49687 [Stachybotrys elegans]
MMTSSQPRGNVGGSFASRRGHATQLSISDPSHHVTEAIGTLYGDDDDSGSESGRPLSFIGGSYNEQIHQHSPDHDRTYHDQRSPLTRSFSDQPQSTSPLNGDHPSFKKSQTLPVRSLSQRNGSLDSGPLSPRGTPLSLRDVHGDSSVSQFSLTNIDNPNDIAQELSNLQALRRLSMDVGNSIDPDMPPMSLSAMPAIAPSGDDDENDPSRLLWVPARVHPELAPTEFKSFLEKRVQSIRRRSGESLLSVDGDMGRGSTGGSLSRRKSMLSHQIDESATRDYVDGAERLERSQGMNHRRELSIDEFVKDPTAAVQKLAQESQNSQHPDVNPDDMPILPMVPGMGLQRSKRTTYRKGGSIRSGDKASFSRRMAQRQIDGESGDAALEAPPGHKLTRVQSEPIAENYSRPTRSGRSLRRQDHLQESSGDLAIEGNSDLPPQAQEQLSVRRTVPTVGVTAPEDESNRQYVASMEPKEPSREVRSPPPSNQYNSRTTVTEALSTNPSAYPGSASTRTDALTIIPTLDERKSEPKSKKEDESGSSGRSSSWKWFGRSEDKEKRKEESKKSKARASTEKQDNVRLDVIQTSIDKTAKSRESLVLDRDNVDTKLFEERKKESNRRSDSKKDKDGSIFSSIFGGSKKKEEKEKSTKKVQHLQVPEEPAYKPMVPDVDYHWTRFPLLEERAIYRMAHIKLANPRRPLHSQVLLSNFMYSYLAIVQAMHPQMNVPTSPQQKRLEEESRRKQQEEYLAQQQMQQDQDEGLDQYDYDYHRAAVQYADSGNDQVDYVDEAQIYEDEHGNDHNGYDYSGSEDYGQGTKEYYNYHDAGDDRRHGRDDMW